MTIILCESCRKPTGMGKWPTSRMKGICWECLDAFNKEAQRLGWDKSIREFYEKRADTESCLQGDKK